MAIEPSSGIQSAVSHLFRALVFLLVLLPTGSVFGLNIKVVALFIFLVSLLLYVVHHQNALDASDLMFLLLATSFLSLLALASFLGGRAQSKPLLQELQDIASTVFIAWLSIFAVRKSIVRAEGLIATVVCAVVAVSSAKVILIAISLLAHVDVLVIVESIFGLPFVTGPIPFGLFRWQTPVDVLGPFAVFLLLAPSVSGIRCNRILSLFISLIVLASGFVAFSRYIWFVFAFAVFAAMVVQRNWKVFGAAAAIICIAAALNPDFLRTLAEARFLSQSTGISDDVRDLQARVLLQEFEERPILGQGIGAHANPIDVTDSQVSYTFELQWLGLLMQTGIIGMLGIAALISASVRDLIMARHRARPWVLLLFLLWLLSGFTNPYMTTSFAAITFGLFMAMFYRLRNVSEVVGQPA